jgi:hypothetical protein
MDLAQSNQFEARRDGLSQATNAILSHYGQIAFKPSPCNHAMSDIAVVPRYRETTITEAVAKLAN